MFCPNCGSSAPAGAAVCPNCGTALPQPQPAPQPVPQPQPAPAPQAAGKVKRGPTKNAKNFAAIFSALLVFPATVCIAIDLTFHNYDFWFGYVVGALIVTWVVAVLPVLRITPAPVTALICFGAIVCYFVYIATKLGWMARLLDFWMPLLIVTALLLAAAAVLIGGKHVKGLHILSLLSAEVAAWFICLEALLDRRAFGVIDLRWSLILACGFVSFIAVLEAVNYVLNSRSRP